jgi:hypothetical protein
MYVFIFYRCGILSISICLQIIDVYACTLYLHYMILIVSLQIHHWNLFSQCGFRGLLHICVDKISLTIEIWLYMFRHKGSHCVT